ncbi:N-acetylmuramate alpha-1-phosphate uridylyltransferase MurU [uncultured Shewanella sp.]|uniref:N-acetylmuramate alpha-1-phosphate uridylyltransferase MurU n=1 Tax=uncultured Shewanella sp. TaxID=173975 RepID=UPI002632BB81|nr:nucleotidyltransferase family protein [uncultured Shewanella sp.]
MKAMILAAGRGERLRPLTDHVPKPLVKVNEKSLIQYHIENLARIGVQDIVINLAWLGDKIIHALGSGEQWGVRLHYSQEETALDTGGGIKHALPLLGDAPFLVINGDIFIDELPSLPALKQEQQAYVWLVDNPTHNPRGDFCLVNEKVKTSGYNMLTFSGIGLYCPSFFSQCEDNSFPLGPLLRKKMEQNTVLGTHMTTFWCDVGTIDRLDALEKRLAVDA